MTEVLYPAASLPQTEPEIKNANVKPSVIRNWQRFIDFILRHLSQITLSYESWAAEEETLFCAALEFIEKLEGAALSLSDLKKMAKKLKELKEKADLANLDKYGDPIPGAENPNPDPSPIFSYLDLMCRLKNLSTVAGDFQKSLKKNNVAGLEDQAQVQKFWKALCLPRVDLSQISMKDTTAGPKEIWMALCRTVFHLSFKYLRLAADSSGIDLLADSELVAYNLINEEQKQAERIVKAISDKLGKGASDPKEMSLADRLAALGAKEKEQEKELVGMSDAGTVIMPPSPPEQVPLKKKGKKSTKSGTRAGSSKMTRGHHRKGKKK